MIWLTACQALVLTVPASPGSSPEHWTTKSVVTGVVIALGIWIIAFVCRKSLITRTRDSAAFRIIVFITEPVVAVVLSVIGSFFDIFKRSTYIPTAQYQPDWHVVFWFCVWAALGAYYIGVKITSIVTKEGEEFKSKALTQDLEKERTAKLSLAGQRDLLVKITSFARQAVTKKIDRLGAIASSDQVTVEEFWGQLNPAFQMQLLLKIVHEFFKPTDPNVTLRLALWMKNGPNDGELSPAYSWDGEKDGCFTHRSKSRMALLDPLGARSEVVKCYHSHVQSLKIIPDCVKAAEKQEFDFFILSRRKKSEVWFCISTFS